MKTPNKLLAIYNTCGLSGRDNGAYYISAIKTILGQQCDGLYVVMSDCMGRSNVRNQIQKEFGNSISYNFIDEKLPVNVTFNHAILKGIKEWGEFEGYLYVDSGVQFIHNQQLQQLYDLLDHDCGMVSARVDDDSGAFINFGLGSHEGDQSQEHKLFKDGDLTMPLGRAVNLHCQIFSNTLQKFYGRCFTDIFASWCSESVFSFMCAALNTKWVVAKDVIVHHNQGVDGQSSGFNPQEWKAQNKDTVDHPFLVDSIVRIMQEGQQYGLGYEEAQGVIMHHSDKYDEEGYCLDTKLKQYIKHNLFLPQSLLDYQGIHHTWIA